MIAKAFADGWHGECDHGADGAQNDRVEEHWGLVRLTLLFSYNRNNGQL